jgi:hypothetical protein
VAKVFHMPLSFHPPAGIGVFEAAEFFHTPIAFRFPTRIGVVP